MQKYKGSLETYKQLHANKMDNLEEIDRYLENFKLPRLTQEEREIMNKPTTSTEIETVIKKKKKKIPKNQKPGARWIQRWILPYI